MAPNRVVIRYHEVALKGANRTLFVRRLSENVLGLLAGTGVRKAYRAPGRIILALSADANWAEIRDRLQRVFGIANFLLCKRTPPSLDGISRYVLAGLGDRRFESFAVRTRRSDKTFPVLSPEVSRVVGQAVRERTGSRVDLDRPELQIHVEILPRETFVSLEKVEGPGGLPVGSSGAVLALLSGGIDSPVAAHRMMQRGCSVDFLHFHGAPFQSRASRDKTMELVEVLSRWQGASRLHLVPFGEIQRQIVARARRLLRVVLYRRMMMRIAAAVAGRIGAAALVTGDSLGQVASQTIPNLAVVEAASPLPVLRPLIAMDKREITTQAEHLGTFAISIQPDDDCCRLFVPRHPATRASSEEVLAAEESLEIGELVAQALESVETIPFAFPGWADRQAGTTVRGTTRGPLNRRLSAPG